MFLERTGKWKYSQRKETFRKRKRQRYLCIFIIINNHCTEEAEVKNEKIRERKKKRKKRGYANEKRKEKHVYFSHS